MKYSAVQCSGAQCSKVQCSAVQIVCMIRQLLDPALPPPYLCGCFYRSDNSYLLSTALFIRVARNIRYLKLSKF